MLLFGVLVALMAAYAVHDALAVFDAPVPSAGGDGAAQGNQCGMNRPAASEADHKTGDHAANDAQCGGLEASVVGGALATDLGMVDELPVVDPLGSAMVGYLNGAAGDDMPMFGPDSRLNGGAGAVSLAAEENPAAAPTITGFDPASDRIIVSYDPNEYPDPQVCIVSADDADTDRLVYLDDALVVRVSNCPGLTAEDVSLNPTVPGPTTRTGATNPFPFSKNPPIGAHLPKVAGAPRALLDDIPACAITRT